LNQEIFQAGCLAQPFDFQHFLFVLRLEDNLRGQSALQTWPLFERDPQDVPDRGAGKPRATRRMRAMKKAEAA
jgi:hypothetical protein